jgi:cellulose synthase/poly-beta-1,6-N-acetylglucosamine synthase-like glycosyltransferase
MKISVIIAIYKDIEALELILDSLAKQSYPKDFEIIIAEDGEDKSVKNFISNLSYSNIIHTTQIDNGWQKNKSLNNAINSSSGEFLIFLDGDCIPYSNFVENYSKYIQNKRVLCGRRVDLGAKVSKKIRDKTYTIENIEKNYLSFYLEMKKDLVRHYEEGIKLSKFFFNLKYHNKTSHILGCNFGLNKKDIIDINGFNEDYITPAVGEDTDIEYRLVKNGCDLKPIRNLSNVIHLHHKVNFNDETNIISMKVLNNMKVKKQIICKNGIKKL